MVWADALAGGGDMGAWFERVVVTEEEAWSGHGGGRLSRAEEGVCDCIERC